MLENANDQHRNVDFPPGHVGNDQQTTMNNHEWWMTMIHNGSYHNPFNDVKG